MATYETSPIELLSQQHREVEDLFAAYEEASSPADKLEVFETIADKLAVHGRIEEELFYPAVQERKTEGMVLEAFGEHQEIKKSLAALLDTDPQGAGFDEGMRRLKEQVERHVEEEEVELFTAAEDVLSSEDMSSLAEAMAEMAAELEGTEPRREIPDEVGPSAPIA